MAYNLTENQKDLLWWMVHDFRARWDGQPGVANHERVRVPQPGQSTRKLRVQDAAASHSVSPLLEELRDVLRCHQLHLDGDVLLHGLAVYDPYRVLDS